jgi:hypothetical protein
MSEFPYFSIRVKDGHEQLINLDNVVYADAYQDGTVQLQMCNGKELTIDDKKEAADVLLTLRSRSSQKMQKP